MARLRHALLPAVSVLRPALRPRRAVASVQAFAVREMPDLAVTTWDSTIAEAHVKHNISNHDCLWEAMARHCLPFSKGKRVADLGAGDGTLGKLLEAESMMNVDPFPPEDCPERIIKRDGVDFLRAQPDQSLDLVISTFAVHFMDRPSLDKELARVLRPSGRAIWFSFSRSSGLFGNQDFNEAYYSVGFDEDGSGAAGSSEPTEVLRVQRPTSYGDLRNHIEFRCHSNLKQMSDDTVARLVSLIPPDLSALEISLDVFEFAPDGGGMTPVRGAPRAA